MGFKDFAFSLQVRDAIKRIAGDVVSSMRPESRYGIVTDINYERMRSSVLLTSATESVTVHMGSVQPLEVGQRVRVEGSAADSYIAEVYGRTANIQIAGKRVADEANMPWTVPANSVVRFNGFGNANEFSQLSGGIEAVGNYGLRVPIDGWYMCGGSVRWATTTQNQTQLRLYKGADGMFSVETRMSSTNDVQSLSTLEYLQAEEVLSVHVFSSVSRSLTGGSSWAPITNLWAIWKGSSDVEF